MSDIGGVFEEQSSFSSFDDSLVSFPSEQHLFVKKFYTPCQQKFIASVLHPQDIAAIHDPADYLTISLIQGMSFERLHTYEFHYTILDMKHYMQTQIPWLRDEKWYLGQKLNRAPKSEEFISEFQGLGLGAKFRAYYILKFLKDTTKVVRNNFSHQ